MGDRPLSRKERQAQTRRRLLAAAARAFTAKGYHGASVSEIARTAGFTTGALYANFASKEQLFIELIDQHVSAQRAEVEKIAAAAHPEQMREGFRVQVERLMAGLVEPGDLFRPAGDDHELTVIQVHTLALEFLLYAARHRPDLRRAIAERYRAVDAVVARAIRAWLAAEGRDSAIDPDDLAVAQSWVIEGLGLRLLMDPELITPERAAHLYHALVADLPLGGQPADPPP